MPTQMTTAESRVIDPILSTHAVGFQEPSFAGHELFPAVETLVHGGKIVDHQDNLTEVIETLRAPGADAAEVHVRYGSRSYALETHGLDAVVPREVWQDAEMVPTVQIAARAVEQALKPVQRNLEIAHAAIARNAASYAGSHKVALAGATQWSDPASDPLGVVTTAVNTIELDSGGTDIVVLVPSDVMVHLRQHPQIMDRIKYTQTGIVTAELLAVMFGVRKVVVGRSLKKVAGARARIWGNDVIVAHVPMNRTIDEPSFGYTFRLRGTPSVGEAYYRRKNRSWIYDVDADHQAQLVMPEAGYLIQNAA